MAWAKGEQRQREGAIILTNFTPNCSIMIKSRWAEAKPLLQRPSDLFNGTDIGRSFLFVG